MRKFIFLFALFSSFVFANNPNESNLSLANVSFVNLEIAFIDFRESTDLSTEESIGSLEMLYSNEELNVIFNSYVKKYNINDSNYVDTKIISINGLPYLRSYSDDGYVSTTGLETVYSKERGGITLKTRGITCTTQSCSNNQGCVPHSNGIECTRCGISSDCTKSVTAE